MEKDHNPLSKIGRVKWFDTRKGFGFVELMEGGPDILLHGNVLRNFGQNSIFEGSVVEVIVRKSTHGFHVDKLLSHTPPTSDGSMLLKENDNFSSEELNGIPVLPARTTWYDRASGFGFAQAFGDPRDIFIHSNVLHNSGLDELMTGEAIGIRCGDNKRGRIALQVLAWKHPE